ncbi:MAG: 5-(carboxyamino)imidazole ribonucleotide synthase [Alphaproteobacteria bacterium]|nr:5-(carboxyamino)imidazole ribonucleotide synthase [Alphaproteobacteria bacterium]
MKTIPPGGIIGMLGGGQLGRMTAMAAARLGYRVHVFCPEDDAPALQVCDMHVRGDFLDEKALTGFARNVDVITLEWENIPIKTLEVLSYARPVHPGAAVLRVAQDRVLEKTFARDHGLGTAAFRPVHSATELAAAAKDIGLPALLKSTRMGYDGKGQVLIAPGADMQKAWSDMGAPAGILEALVDFECEVSVIVARRADGAVAAYPPVRNIHRNQILAETRVPAGIAPAVAEEALKAATGMAAALDVVGLLAVEMFVLKQADKDGHRVLVNEIAPRPHNSGHWTIDACGCSQFEQLVRAVCGLPLGTTEPHSRAVMHNLLGSDVDQWQDWLKQPNARLHLYGKAEARPGRKMGHVTVVDKL